MPSPAIYVPHWSNHSHRKASRPRSASYETHKVALEELEGPRITRKSDTSPQVAPPSLKMVARGKQCATRSTITITKTCSADIYRRIKRRVGRSLKGTHWKGILVPSRKQVAHKPSGTKGGLSGLKRVQIPLFEHSSGGHRQHNSGCLYKQRRGMKWGPLCALLWRILTGNSQTFQTRPNHSNRMVPSPRGFLSHMLPVVPAQSGRVCHQVQQQTATVCVTGSRPPGMGSGCTQSVLGRSGPICLPTSSHLGQSGGEVAGPPMQQNHTHCTGWPNMPWFWDLVAMSKRPH